MKKYKIGIIGYGDFTSVLIDLLLPYAEIIVSSRSRHEGEIKPGANFASTGDVLSSPIIIPSIPAQYIEGFFKEHIDLVNQEALIIDVCSVKTYPLRVLSDILPSTCRVIGTHPMFGPASIKKNNGARGLKCVVCPNEKATLEVDIVIQFISKDLGIEVIKMTAEQHDKEMAYVQGLSHYIGRIMQNMSIPDSKISTLAYDDLIDMKNIQGSDSWELFRSIMHQNPYAMQINEEFKKACLNLDRKLRES